MQVDDRGFVQAHEREREQGNKPKEGGSEGRRSGSRSPGDPFRQGRHYTGAPGNKRMHTETQVIGVRLPEARVETRNRAE